MSVQIVRFTTSATDVPAVEAAIETMVAAIHRERPPGTRFSSWKLADGVTFLNVLELEDGVDNPLLGIPECRAYQKELARWVAEPPRPQPVTVVGAYA
ncbi:hypothetical protein FHX44_111432 [Pseudonocardia hierapolitana]|uniref:Antibiotic biosynthesis monooxygenase n=1 Tax=Pseudonocardia hierapolitana TaxID=1128676 RepID=A0A561SL13_9PSEU|nr:hypothetical protein [Pseudonocardia hierapolitana]TWF75548.1 hypothetical protein FHX44_111432 [Pseudonocardia hierapolitana]